MTTHDDLMRRLDAVERAQTEHWSGITKLVTEANAARVDAASNLARSIGVIGETLENIELKITAYDARLFNIENKLLGYDRWSDRFRGAFAALLS